METKKMVCLIETCRICHALISLSYRLYAAPELFGILVDYKTSFCPKLVGFDSQYMPALFKRGALHSSDRVSSM